MTKKSGTLTATLLLCVSLTSCSCNGIFQSHEHQYTSKITQPTCTELGYTTYTCECGDTYSNSYVNALGHKHIVDAAVEPNCTNGGFSAGVHCETCGEIIIAQATLPPKHNWSAWEHLSEATCYVDGERKHVCIDCEHEECEPITKLTHNFITNEETGVSSCEICQAIQFNGNIYQVFNESLSWSDAKAYCENLGGHLATITSAEEQATIEMLVNKISADCWIGGEKILGEYVWITGEEFIYENWNSGEPNNENGIEDKIEFTSKYTWNDIRSTPNQRFICEWEGTEE